jgi:hypothetical protein
MVKIKLIIIAIIFVIIISFIFYWFEWRPVKIRKQCDAEAKQKNSTQLFQKINMDYESIYKQCLRRNGTEK